MLKYQLNQLHLTISCKFDGPFLIKDGRDEHVSNSNQPSAVFISRDSTQRLSQVVRNNHDILQTDSLDYYIPATSIRGWIRSHAEKIVRTMSENQPRCCDPFDGGVSCSKILQDKTNTSAYKRCCPICKIFGAGGQASRISFTDGEFVEDFNIRLIDNIAIDRFTGRNVNLFKTQTFENGEFTFCLTINNFEVWQLGLLAFVFRDMELGRLALGSGKSKGFGKMVAHLESGYLAYWRLPENNRLSGIADLMESLRDSHGAKSFISESDSDKVVEATTLILASDTQAPLALETFYKLPLPGDNQKLTDLPFWRECAAHFKNILSSFEDISPRAIEETEDNESEEHVAGGQ